MKPKSFDPSGIYGYRLSIVLITLLFLTAYFPFVLRGGLISDDWSVRSNAYFNSGLWQNCYYWVVEVSPQRPLQALLAATTGYIFGGNTAGYIILNLSVMISSILCTALILKKYTGKTDALLFILFASIPTIASTSIFSPAMLIVTPVTTFLWSLSLFTLDQYMNNQKKVYYVLTYVLIFLALLIFEVILPFLVITVLLPMSKYLENGTALSLKFLRNYFIKFFVPVISIVLGIIIFQKLTAHSLATQIHLVPGIKVIIKTFVAWASSFTTELCFLLINSAMQLGTDLFSRPDILLTGVTLIIFSFIFVKIVSSHAHLSEKVEIRIKERFFLGIVILALLSCPILFIVSNYIPVIHGYDNRLMHSTWFLLSMILAWATGRIFRTKICFVAPVIIFFLFASIIAQRDNFILSWALQQKIINDCTKKAEQADVRQDSVIIGNVPKYLPNNLNNEEVFNNIWDFGSALRVHTDGLVYRGIPINSTKLRQGRFIVKDNFFFVNRVWKPKFSADNLWYYEYDQQTAQSKFIQISGIQHLQSILEEIKEHNINAEPMRAHNGVRTLLREIANWLQGNFK